MLHEMKGKCVNVGSVTTSAGIILRHQRMYVLEAESVAVLSKDRYQVSNDSPYEGITVAVCSANRSGLTCCSHRYFFDS